MTALELNREQKIELKQNYLTELDDSGMLEKVTGITSLSYGILNDADRIVPDMVIYDHYKDVEFSEDDFEHSKRPNIWTDGMYVGDGNGEEVYLTSSMVEEVLRQIKIREAIDLLEDYTDKTFSYDEYLRVAETLGLYQEDDSGDTKWRAITDVLGSHFQNYTWEALCRRAGGAAHNSKELLAKDTARAELESLIIEETEVIPEQEEIPEEVIDDFLKNRKETVWFDEDGHMLESKKELPKKKTEQVIKYMTNEYNQFSEDLEYWSNSIGELHHHGKYDISEEELPTKLKAAYRNLWEDGLGSLCYLAEYRGEYGVVLVNEYNDESAELLEVSMNRLFNLVAEKANSFSQMEEFSGSTIMVVKCTGDEHELIVFLPWNTSKEKFRKVTDILSKEAYNLV